MIKKYNTLPFFFLITTYDNQLYAFSALDSKIYFKFQINFITTHKKS